MSIVSAVGLPGLSVLELSHMLNRLGVSYGVVRNGRLARVQGRMEKQSLYPVVFLSASMLLRTYKKFTKTRVVALVLDNPFALQHEIGLTLAGATFTKNSILFSQFTESDLRHFLISCKDKTEALHFQRVPYSLVSTVLKEYSASSLSAIQTFLYKIKDVESRDVVSKVVKKWMTSNEQFAVLEPKLKKYIGVKSIEALKSIINTPNMKLFREAVRKAAQNPSKTARVAKEYKVSAFDIKYLLSTTA